MKKTILFFSILLSALAIYAQSQVKHEVIYTIAANESLVVAESSAGLACEGGEICLTVYEASSQNFYVYRNGVKNGPYKKNEIANYMCKKDVMKFYDSYDYEGNYAEPDISIDNNERSTLRFKGKIYGPYEIFAHYTESSNGENFAALVGDENLNYSIISSLGSEFKISGSINNIVFDASGTKFLVTTTTQSDIDAIINAKMMEIIDKELSEEEVMRIVTEINELQENASGEEKASKAWVCNESGTKYGPFSDQLYNNNPSFYNGNSNFWLMVSDNTIFINAKEIASFPDSYINVENVILSDDGTKWAVWTYDKIVLWDRTDYPYPLYATVCNGKLVWLSLKDNTKVIRYSVPF